MVFFPDVNTPEVIELQPVPEGITFDVEMT